MSCVHSTASATTTESVDMKTILFNNYMVECNSTTIPTFSGIYKDKKVYFFGQMKRYDTFTTKKLKRCKNGGVPQIAYSEWKCMTCVERVSNLARYVSKTGPFLCSNSSSNKGEIHLSLEKSVRDTYDSNKEVSKCGLKIMYEDLYNLTEGGTTEETFHHYSYKLDHKTVRNPDMIMLQNCFKKYTDILDTFFEKIEDNDEFLECLGILKRCIHKVEYGDKLSQGTEWLIKNMVYMNTLFEEDKSIKCYKYLPFLKKLEFLGNVMCDSKISKGYTVDDVNMLEHSQANNSILNLLKNAKDESALMSMIRKQVSPENYQRRTAEPKLGHIAAAEAKLGEFSNTMYTMDKLEKHEDCVKVVPKTKSEGNSSMGAFAAMKANSSKSSKFGGLSKRCGKPIEIKNMKDLVAKIKDGSIYKLKINANNMTSSYVADTTLDREKIIHDYLWLFLNNETYRFCGYEEVSHLNFIEISTHRNIIFILKEARQSIVRIPVTKNCCIPEFLDTSIRRTCGSAFEKMNSLTNINIPESGDLAFGIGTSITGTDNKLMNTIKFLINDEATVRTITHY